ncbi:MAG: hypothetical protein IT306_15685 [Chloroflexi bacterium]|nr:hypothetical protein [Chloroflexota bacterium]
MEEQTPTPCAWVIKQHLNPDALKEYVSRMGIQRSQVIAVTEPQDGMFTLIFEPNAEQQTALAAEESEVAETLDALFGAPVTPVQAPGGAEVETVVAVPAMPAGVPPPAPAEPTPA